MLNDITVVRWSFMVEMIPSVLYVWNVKTCNNSKFESEWVQSILTCFHCKKVWLFWKAAGRRIYVSVSDRNSHYLQGFIIPNDPYEPYVYYIIDKYLNKISDASDSNFYVAYVLEMGWDCESWCREFVFFTTENEIFFCFMLYAYNISSQYKNTPIQPRTNLNSNKNQQCGPWILYYYLL